MKKVLSIVLAILVMATSCVCAFTTGAVGCSDGHTFDTKKSISDYSHTGTCLLCQEVEISAHDIYISEKTEPQCKSAGITVYKCRECDYEKEERVNSLGHDYVITKFEYTVVEGIAKVKRTDTCCYGCEEIFEGNAGSTNTCPRCTERTLTERIIYYPNCVSGGYTLYRCTNCSEFKSDEKNKTDHDYTDTVIPATCVNPGKTVSVCNCSRYDIDKTDGIVIYNATREGKVIPPKGHRLEKAGETYKYTYKDGKCYVSGKCADCDAELGVGTAAPLEKLNVTPEQCPDCGNNINYKEIRIPTDCSKGAVIIYRCPKNNADIAVEALPVGHVARSTTYNYVNGEYKDTVIDCFRCGPKVVISETYNKDVHCALCTGIITKRVEVAPVCDEKGRTVVTCSQCGEYIESVEFSNGHNPKVSEWTFDYLSDTYTMKASCKNYGCGGFEKTGKIGILGKCVNCGEIGTLMNKKVTHYDCMSKELIEYQCTNCCPTVIENGQYVIKVMSKTEGNAKKHNSITDEITATCTVEGCTKTTCVDCYYTTTKDVVPALGHVINSGVIDYENNKRTGYCVRCKTDINEECNEIKECLMPNCDGVINKEVITRPNCSSTNRTDGYTRVYCSKGCTNYDYIGYYIPNNSIIKAAHSYGEWTIVKQATCSDVGIQERTCANCGEKDTDEIPANTTESGDPKHVFLVMERGYAATCTSEGLSDWVYCSQCNLTKKAVVIPALGHSLDPNSTNKNFCSRCNSYIIETDEEDVVCSCMCHNEDGLAKFFFKIILFFCQIFGINQKCDCGKIH